MRPWLLECRVWKQHWQGLREPPQVIGDAVAQLTSMIEAYPQAIESIAKQSEKPRVQAMMSDLCEHIQGGNSFSDALARHPRSFPMLYIALIRASGRCPPQWTRSGE